MGGVMAGIAEALVATGVGLFVALPAVVAYNVIQKRIGEIESAAISLSKLITAHVKSTRPPGGAPFAVTPEAEERDEESRASDRAAPVADLA